MGLSQDIEDMQEYNSKAKELKDSIIQNLEKNFILLNYEIKLQEIYYPSGIWHPKDDETLKLLYPILDVPENYKKQEKHFIRESINGITYEYSLRHKNEVINITETANFKHSEVNAIKCKIVNRGFYMVDKVKYHVEVNGTAFDLIRIFKIKDILEKVVGDIEIRYNDFVDEFFSKKSNENQEHEYSEFIKQHCENPNISTLEEIVNSGILSRTIQIEEKLPLYQTIKVSEKIIHEQIAIGVMKEKYENMYVELELPVSEYEIKVQICLKLTDDTLKECGDAQTFQYFDISKKILDKAVRLSEIMENSLLIC